MELELRRTSKSPRRLDGESGSCEVIPQRETATRASKARHRACTECRRSKLRCDTRHLPCVRCANLKLLCHIDAPHKKTSNKSKVAQLQSQVEQLQLLLARQQRQVLTSPAASGTASLADPSILMGSASIGATPSTARTDLIDPEQVTAIDDLTRNATNAVPLHRVVLPQPPASCFPSANSPTAAPQDRHLEDVRLKRDQINFLFQEFFGLYHPYLSLLEPSVSPDQYYESSPLLFWTIIGIGARRYRNDPSLLAALSPAITRLIWSSIPIRPHSHFLVNSLLLHVFWPLPAITPLSAETSSIFLGIAVHAAIQLGLHRPEDIQDFGRRKVQLTDEEINLRASTWAACCIVSQSAATRFGYQPLAIFNWTINCSCEVGNRYTVNKDLRHQLLIERLCHRVGNVMLELDDQKSVTPLPSSQQPLLLLKILEHEWDNLESSLRSENMSTTNYIYLLSGRMNTLMYHFFEPLGTASRKQGIINGYTTATELISTITAADELPRRPLYIPEALNHSLTLAAFLVFKILNSSYSQYIDPVLAMASYSAATIALRECSVISSDLSCRQAELLTQIWRVEHTSSKRHHAEPSLRVKSRMSASVYHDCVWTCREEFGGEANAFLPQKSSAGNRSTQPTFDGDLFDTLDLGQWEFLSQETGLSLWDL